VYALKTYRGWNAERSWNKEVEHFQKLQNGVEGGSSPNVIGFYTAFKHGKTCYCILEYADRGSLEDYLQNNVPPTDGIDIARLWKRVLHLIRGLQDLHNGRDVM
jgi:serine/threonine protein kinase